MALAFFQLERAAGAQTSPSPAPSSTPVPEATAKPNPFTVRGYFRAYDFTRQNASGFASTASQLNQQSANFAGSLHLDYRILNSGFSVGVSYLYANPLNGCNDPRSTAFKCATLAGSSALMNPDHRNPDTTLPGYGMSTFYETYLQYEKNGVFARIGDQVINTPWAYSADSRLKPNAFQGADISYQITPHLTFEVMDMDRYQSRTTTDFTQETLLTGALTELPHTANPAANTGGFQYARVGYTSGNLTSNLHYYHFDDLAYLGWLDGKYTLSHQRFAPYIAIQAGDEKNVGSSIVGKINSQVYGAQLGVNVTKNLAFTVGSDVIPRHIENLPAGSVCSASTGQIAPRQTYPNPSAGYFVGMNAPQCIANSNGTDSVEYGGIASPYTYTGDPLFTTSLTQGMAIRGAPGSSEKLALTYTSTDKRLVLAVSHAYYDYGFDNFPDQTTETDGDAMYHLSKVGKGPYRGLLMRYRYGVRTDDHSSALNFPPVISAGGVYFGGLPYFVYNRAQLEYDF
jgi:hypothetical protein